MASPIAHGLAGIGIMLLSQPAHSRHHPLPRMLFAAAAGCLMDSDFIIGFFLGKSFHHAQIHTIAFIILSTALIFPFWRPIGWSFRRRFTALTLMIGSHLVLDYFTADTSKPYGVMAFWPLSDTYYIFPYPIFLDVWRGSLELVFGYHNMNVALRETAIGGLFLMLVAYYRKFPVPLIRLMAGTSACFTLLSIFLNGPLSHAAEQQIGKYYGQINISASTHQTGNRGILFVATHESNTDIYLIQEDGSGRKRLTTDPAEDSWPIWSPDGEKVLFQTRRSGNWDIFMMNPDGTGIQQVTQDASDEEYPYWSPDGKSLIFSSNRSGNYELYTMSLDGSNLKQVNTPSPDMDILPSVSPGDGQISYTSRSNIMPGWHIYSLPWQGGESQRISPEFGCRAKWSPDGQYLAYVSAGENRTSDIWIFHRSGRGLRRLLNTPEYDYDPVWSPDGRSICFSRGREAKSGWDLWIVNTDGTQLRPLTTDGLDNRYPSWR